MNVRGRHYRTIWPKPGEERVIQLIDQRSLPHRFVIEEVRTGDHTFFIAEILGIEEGRAAASLCYVHRGYHAL